MLFSLDLSSALKEVCIQYQLLLVISYLLAIWFIIACFIVKEDIIAFIVLSSVFFIFGKVIELIMNGIGENTKSKDKDDSYFMFNYFGLFGLGIFLGVEYSIIRIILVVAFIFIILLDKMYYLWLLHKYSDEGIWLSKKGKIGFITSILLFILKPIIYILFIIASSRHIFKFVHKVYKSINHNLQKDVTLFYVLIKLLVTAVMTIAYIGGIGKFFFVIIWYIIPLIFLYNLSERIYSYFHNRKIYKNINKEKLNTRPYIYECFNKLSGYYQRKLITYLENNIKKVSGEWTNKDILNISNEDANIRLAKLEEKWLGLDR